MLSHAFSRLLPLFYVKISAERVTVRNVKARLEVSEVPEIAIGNDSGKKPSLPTSRSEKRC
jgi:hypothetical protein